MTAIEKRAIKFIVLLWVIILFPLALKSQPRVNEAYIFHKVAESKTITEPIGWNYDTDTKKWCGYYGLCLPVYKRNSETPIRLTTETISGYGSRGIYSLQIKKIVAKNKTFYLLYHIYWDGEYRYPTLQVDWVKYKSCRVWLITSDEYEKLKDLSIGLNSIILYDYTLTDHYPAQSYVDELEARINRMVQDALQTGTVTKPDQYRTPKFYIKVEDDGKTIRFQLPSNKYLWSEAEEINKTNEKKKLENKWFHYTPIYKSDCIDFDEEYFEVTNIQFNNLIVD